MPVRVGWGFGPEYVMSKMKAVYTCWSLGAKTRTTSCSLTLDNTEAVDTFVNEYKGRIAHSLAVLHAGIQEMKS